MTSMNTIDLHLHTNFSDGKFTPEELLQKAAAAGLVTVAITDHDNANGSRQARPAAARLGLELVPGIELTTSWPGLELPPGELDVDLLGYFIDLESPALGELERAATADIYRRMDDCLGFLTATGCPLTREDMLQVNPNFPSLTAAILAVQAKGYAAEWVPGHQLVMTGWRQVRPAALHIGQAIAAIHAAGGAAVLAHPAAVAWKDSLLPEAALAELVAMGLDGLEVYHHRNDERARQQFLAQARQFGLLVSGGSDEHGWWKSRLATQPVTAEMLEALRIRAGKYRV